MIYAQLLVLLGVEKGRDVLTIGLKGGRMRIRKRERESTVGQI